MKALLKWGSRILEWTGKGKAPKIPSLYNTAFELEAKIGVTSC
jgi:hypothetical protein